jgi:hypothetical protein
MDAIISLLNNALTRRAVRTYEQYNLSHDMTSFYKVHLFRTDIKPQPESRLLTLPPEIRHIIYEYVFTPSQATKSSDIVAVLATCRLVNQEAVNMALQRVHWRIITDSALVYRKGLWNLGNLQHHLRHIDVEMPLAKIDPVGANNPFLLSHLRLDHLQITFTDIENLEDWHDEVELYHKLISALMYREPSGKFSGEYVPTTEVYRSRQLSAKRQSELTMWNFQPTSTQLVHVMLNLQAKELVVKRKSNQEDILWSAFKYFRLVYGPSFRVKNFLDKPRIGGNMEVVFLTLTFFDEDGSSFFRMARTDPVFERTSWSVYRKGEN